MCITANRQLLARLNANLHHRRLGVHKVLDSLDNLEDILAVDLLSILEPLNHVVNEFLCHFLAEAHTIVTILNLDSTNIQIRKCGGRVRNLNGLLEVYPANELFTLGSLELRALVVGLPLGNSLEILQSILVIKNGSISQTTAPISLEETQIQHISSQDPRGQVYRYCRVCSDGPSHSWNQVPMPLQRQR
jgi:hypothetical protein